MLGYAELNLTAINPGRFILGMMEPPWSDGELPASRQGGEVKDHTDQGSADGAIG